MNTVQKYQGKVAHAEEKHCPKTHGKKTTSASTAMEQGTKAVSLATCISTQFEHADVVISRLPVCIAS